MVTAIELWGGGTREEYVACFGDDDKSKAEAGEAYDTYLKQYEQIAVCINNNDAAGVRRLAKEFDFTREDLADMLGFMGK